MADQYSEHTTLSQAIIPVLTDLESRGVHIDGLLGPLGYSERALREPGSRVPRAVVVALIEAAVRCDPARASGFAIASRVGPEVFDLFEYAARSSASIRQSIEVANRYARVVDDSADFHFEPYRDGVVWRLDMVWPEPVRRYVNEFLLGILRAMGERLLGDPVRPREILCAYPAPLNTDCYRNAFDTPVRFGAHCNGYLLDHETLDLRPPGADRTLAALLTHQAESLLKKTGHAETARERVRRLLLECLPNGEPTMQQIAQRLGMTASTLRRRLAEEGSSQRALLREVRLELARAYLADSRLGLSDIGNLLGFADTSSFFKAFKGMTGKTPSEYRSGLLDEAG